MPKVTKRPVAVRYETPYAEAHASDLLTTVDGLVQQQRLMPGQLKPLLGLMGVGSVITGSDDDIARSGAVDPALAAEELADQDLGRPAHGYGPTIVDGAAQGLAGLAACGARPARRPLLYAGDLSDADLRRYAASGAEVVVTDSNRRWSFVPTDTQQSHGRVLAESEPLDKNSASIEPFPKRGSDAQTVTVLHGATYVRAPEGGPSARRSMPSTATRPRSGPRRAICGPTGAGSRSASSARATSPTSTCCRSTTGAASSARST
jgi:hypothetical protein